MIEGIENLYQQGILRVQGCLRLQRVTSEGPPLDTLQAAYFGLS